ncbi:MAG: Flagellar basal body rod protein FlgB [Pseudomonadota bacterium]|jgi:flagellar basal-body rod protein FlgB
MSFLNGLTNVFGNHEKALQLKSQRLELLARNIANADTPNFKARDLDFKAVLSGLANDTRMDATAAGHYKVGEGLDTNGLRYRTPFNTSFDGNTVELNVEQAQFGKATADYQATLSFLESRVSGMRRALKGE